MTYPCRFCGAETPNFDCVCPDKIDNVELWDRGMRKQSIKLEIKEKEV